MEKNNWFSFAQEDLETARIALSKKIYNQVCFHSEQCVEKALKGFLLKRGKVVPKVHFLEELLNLCAGINDNFKQLQDKCLKLDKYYIVTRYPDAIPGMKPAGLPKKEDAQEALALAEEILDFVKKHL